jgi:hypothetical protein
MLARILYLRLLALLGFSHLCPALPLSFGDATTSFDTQDPLRSANGRRSARTTKCVQRLLYTLCLTLETRILSAQGSDYVVQIGH